jgi:CPA1 family monovalent cation:H+ antiporter
MAITLYTAFIGLALSETAGVGGVLGLFAAEVLGGVLIGALLGVGFSRLTGAIDDHLLEMTLSTALAYGSYLVAQSAHTSGALACVAAGLIHGSYGRHVGMSENTRRLLDDQWEYLGFLANALLFLLVGFSVNVAALLTHLWPVTVAVAAVLFARVLVVGGAAGLLPREAGLRTLPERAVLIWGGLRGALTLALALALPPELPARDMLIAMAFGVVLFTLVVQGLTLPLLVRRTGLGC